MFSAFLVLTAQFPLLASMVSKCVHSQTENGHKGFEYLYANMVLSLGSYPSHTWKSLVVVKVLVKDMTN